MSDIREALAQLLARSRRGVTAKMNDNDLCQADNVLAKFLVVPRSEVDASDSYEYGWQRQTVLGSWVGWKAGDADMAREAAEERRYVHDPKCAVRAVYRPDVPWSPLPDGFSGE